LKLEPPLPLDTRLVAGQVVAAFGQHCLVEAAGGRLLRCLARRKQAPVTCGDRVALLPTGRDDAVIEAIDPRASVFQRSSPHRAKLIAANATQIAMVVAAEPSYSDELVTRVLIAAAHAGMKGMIVLNKVDLAAGPARARLEPLRKAGYAVVELSALRDAEPLKERLRGETTVLVGQSGMGKSTLVNALFPGAGAATQAISKFLDAGKHTTSAARLYRLDAESAVIDSPGVKEFGLAHLERADIEAAMPEFRPFLGKCRFSGCRHGAEPDCAVKQAVAEGRMDARRFELFNRIIGAEAAA
jgi:ribosome biogenesis GTPase